MSNYILTADGKLHHCDVGESELYHYGVPGMKWGRRKARPVGMGLGRRAAQPQSTSPTDQAAQKEARKAKAKKALKIGAAVAATALAAYGAYKVSNFVRNKKTMGKIRAQKIWEQEHMGWNKEAMNKQTRHYNDQLASIQKQLWSNPNKIRYEYRK